MANSNAIQNRAQQAARDFIRAANLSWIPDGSLHIQSGMSRGAAGDDLDIEVKSTPLPSIVCGCQRVSAADATSQGNWIATITVALRCGARETTEGDFTTRLGQVVDLFMDNAAALAGLSALDGFTAFWLNVTDHNYETIGSSWRATISMDVQCCGSNIS